MRRRKKIQTTMMTRGQITRVSPPLPASHATPRPRLRTPSSWSSDPIRWG